MRRYIACSRSFAGAFDKYYDLAQYENKSVIEIGSFKYDHHSKGLRKDENKQRKALF